MSEHSKNSSSKKRLFPRGKSHRETKDKTTVGIYLPKILVKKARRNGLNISRISERALSSILDYLDTQNTEESSEFLSRGSFLKESRVDGAGFEPAASTMPTWRSFHADLPALRLHLLKL